MNNADMPVSPVRGATNVPFRENDITHMGSHMIGLTKREQFAAMAMQGLCAKYDYAPSEDILTRDAVCIADALLKELEE